MQYFTPDSSEREAKLHLCAIEAYLPLLQPLLPGLNWSAAQDLEPAINGWRIPSTYLGGGSLLLLGQLDAWMQLLWLDSGGVVVAEHTLPGDMELADAVEQLRRELPAMPRHTPQAYIAFSLGDAMPLERDQRPPVYSAHAFLAACCTLDPDAWLLSADLYSAYEAYCAKIDCWGLGEEELSLQLSHLLYPCTSAPGKQLWRGAKLNAPPHTNVEQDAAAPEAQETPCAAEKSGQAQDTRDRLREMVGLSAAAWRAARSVLHSREEVQRTERELEAARRQLEEAQDELRSAEARIVNHAPEHTP